MSIIPIVNCQHLIHHLLSSSSIYKHFSRIFLFQNTNPKEHNSYNNLEEKFTTINKNLHHHHHLITTLQKNKKTPTIKKTPAKKKTTTHATFIPRSNAQYL